MSSNKTKLLGASRTKYRQDPTIIDAKTETGRTHHCQMPQNVCGALGFPDPPHPPPLPTPPLAAHPSLLTPPQKQ